MWRQQLGLTAIKLSPHRRRVVIVDVP